MTASAFAPGHVSGLFAVHDEAADPLAKGSRGVGWSVEKGATAMVTRAERTTLTVDGKDANLPVTMAALEQLAPGVGLDVRLTFGLPVGQGFGMSAAGTLAACLAAASELGLEPEAALAATHAAEVASGTGLGDAIGSWNGSGEIRVKPGIPPHGWAMRVDPPAETRMLYLVAGPGIQTPRIIRDAEWKERTRELADPAVERILAVGRPLAWQAMLMESQKFTLQLGLLPAPLQDLAERLPKDVMWGQSMLGTTLWVAGKEPALHRARSVLEGHGKLVELGMDLNGARLVRAS
ncbi:MAG: hypothetical protein AABX89_04640 [Candidatus Thermoplasmatota archaeon]